MTESPALNKANCTGMQMRHEQDYLSNAQVIGGD